MHSVIVLVSLSCILIYLAQKQDKVNDVNVALLQHIWFKGGTPTGCPPNYREFIVPSTKLNGVTQETQSELAHSMKQDYVKTSIWLDCV